MPPRNTRRASGWNIRGWLEWSGLATPDVEEPEEKNRTHGKDEVADLPLMEHAVAQALPDRNQKVGNALQENCDPFSERIHSCAFILGGEPGEAKNALLQDKFAMSPTTPMAIGSIAGCRHGSPAFALAQMRPRKTLPLIHAFQ